MKRAVSLMLAFIMLFAVIPITVFAIDTNGLVYEISPDGTYYTVTDYNGTETEVMIPSTYKDLPVKEIGKNAFRDSHNITSVEIPDSITAIGSFAFQDCWSLSSINIPKSVTSMGAAVFAFCYDLTRINCEAEEKPSGWDDEWNADYYMTVNWGYNSLKIVEQSGPITVNAGKTATAKITAVGVGLTYKWYVKNRNSSGFFLSESCFDNDYSIVMNSDRAGRQVYCVVTDKYGRSVQSKTFTFYMFETVIDQPSIVTAHSGEQVRVAVTVQPDARTTYKWYFKDKGAKEFRYTPSFTGNSYYVTMNAERASRQVYCITTDAYGNSVKSKTVTLGMSVKIKEQPTSVKVANGKQAKVTVSASGEGKTYKWYYKNKGDSKFTLTNSFTGSSYYVTMTNARAGRQIYCVITDKYGNSVKTDTVTLNKK
ncbi:MAG: leucine-rich repeat domain-containing protein [Clostridia bacterium]|nr:leucine-rich repeat domain-containing protein [Clostridia bacterium]